MIHMLGVDDTDIPDIALRRLIVGIMMVTHGWKAVAHGG